MSGPCLADTSSIIMSRDLSGNIQGDVRLHAGDSGLGVVGDGLYVNNLAGDGLVRHAFGLSVRMADGHAGWVAGGASDYQTPNTAVGPGGYVQVGAPLSLNLSIMGTPQVVVQTIRMSYSAEINVTDSQPDIAVSNYFHGWRIILERSFNFGPWVEICGEAIGGVPSMTHSLFGEEHIALGGGVYNMQLRITFRGGVAGFAWIAQSVQHFYMHAEYR